MPTRDETILVTGGAGFIGSHLIERMLASRAARIVCLDNFNDYYSPARKRENVRAFVEHPRLRLVEADFRHAEAMRRLFDEERVTHVVHLGAYAGVRASIERPLVYQDNNVGGTLALLEAARRQTVERFLLVSSSTVYGAGATAPFRESAPLGVPLSPYGASKRAAELFGQAYTTLHGTPVVCLRPFSVYGPRLRPDLALSVFTRAIVEGRALPLFGDGTIRRDFTHVSDICNGLEAALDREQAIGQTFNLGHAEPIEVRAVIELLESAIGKRAVIDRRPEVAGDMPLTHADLTQARAVLQYEAKVPFEDGLREFVQWYLRHGCD